MLLISNILLEIPNKKEKEGRTNRTVNQKLRLRLVDLTAWGVDNENTNQGISSKTRIDSGGVGE